MNEFLKVSYLISPLLFGLAFHGLCMKLHWLHSLALPIDHGLTFRGKRLLGDNKTYRGVIAVAIGTAIGFGIQAILHFSIKPLKLELLDYGNPSVLLIGLAMGAAAMLSELPNSFTKRQFDIAPGAAAAGVASLIFYFFDQVDMLVGVWLVLGFVVPVTFERILWSIVFLFIAHQAVTILGYAIGMRATAR